MLSINGIKTIEEMNQLTVALNKKNETKKKYTTLIKIYASVIVIPFLNYIYKEEILKYIKLNTIFVQIVLIGLGVAIVDFLYAGVRCIFDENKYNDKQIVIAIEQIKLMNMINSKQQK